MNKRQKAVRVESPSQVFSATLRKCHYRSVDLTSAMKQLKALKRKEKRQELPLLMGIDSNFFAMNFMHSLKSSLTVKRIEFSPPKIFTGIQISTVPIRPRVPQTTIPKRVNSFKSIPRARPKAKSIEEPAILKKKAKRHESPQAAPKILTHIKKDPISSRLPVYTPQPARPAKPLPKISYKEASKILKWGFRAKPELGKLWRKIISESNGIKPINTLNTTYKYYIGKGNNSRLINRCFTSRSWWVEVDKIELANFTWTQWKDKKLIETFETGKENSHEKITTFNIAMLSPVSVKTENKQYRMVDIEELGFQGIRNSDSYTCVNCCEVEAGKSKMHNKIEYNQHLSNKKGLFKCLKNYYAAVSKNVFDYVPLTFHVVKGENDLEFIRFTEEFNGLEVERQKNRIQNLWIVKPGENTNRGEGISLANSLDHVKFLISETTLASGEPRTYIIQKYIEKPFLIHKRKFDIRCYSLITSINGIIQGYYYSDGYLRTTSSEYNTKEISNNFIHLTNDAIQKNSEEYGKFEDGNKLSYKDFQRYLDFHCSDKRVNLVNDLLPGIKNIIIDTIKAAYLKIDPNRRLNCMEIFGYDFMLDANLKPWLIEVNTNPCLELASNYLSILIPSMVENALRIAVDPLFPPHLKVPTDQVLENKFELIFHQETDGKSMENDLGEKIEAIRRFEELSDDEEIFSDIE